MKKTAVVIGAAGFVGATLTRRLLREGMNVHGIVRAGSKSLWRLDDVRGRITLHDTGISKPEELKKLWKKMKPSYIFHTATYGSYPSQLDAYDMIAANVAGTYSLLESLRDVPYVNLIVTGSSSEYGKKINPMNEHDVLEPNNFYAATKAAQTHICTTYAKVYNKPVTVLRLFNVYGYYEEKGRLVRSVIESVLSNSPVRLATGKEARDFIFVEDVADACIVAAKKKPATGEVFNIGTGVQTTIRQLAEEVLRITRRTVPIVTGAYEGRVWDTHYWRADMKKTRRVLHWKPEHSLGQGLRKTIAWYAKTL